MRLRGADKLRTWRKLHLPVDHRAHKAAACSVSDQYVLDRRELPRLLGETEGKVAEVLDGRWEF